MKAIAQLKAWLATHGATLDESAEQFLNCDTPSGYVWRANDCTAYHIDIANSGGQRWTVAAIREAMPALRMGLRRVTDPAELAQMRYDLDDETWGAE
jgi:hypothetical protein